MIIKKGIHIMENNVKIHIDKILKFERIVIDEFVGTDD